MKMSHIPRTVRTGQAGSAMIMVLLILGVLMVISLPFLMSMTRHSVNARTYQAETRTSEMARLGQQTATGILASGQTEREWSRRRGALNTGERTRADLFKHPLFITPYMDYSRELSLLRKQLANYYLFDLFNEKRSLGIQLEDEQGKINLLTAPEGLIKNLTSFLSPSDRIESYVTRHSVRPRVYTASTIVDRYSDDKQPGTKINWTTTRHPVNINTAHWKVLAAIFTGIGGDQGDDREDDDESILTNTQIDPSTARKFAKFLAVRTPLNDWYQFRHVLSEADEKEVISSNEQKLIRLNAMRAGLLNRRNRYNINTTVPICFRSYDRYAIDTQATTLNPAGLQRSTSGARRIRSTSKRSASVVLDSGYEFADSMDAIRMGFGIRRKSGFGFIVGPSSMYAQLSKRTLNYEPEQYGTWAKTEDMKSRSMAAEIQPEPYDEGEESPFGTTLTSANVPGDISDGDPPYKSTSTGPGGIKFWIEFDGVPNEATLFEANDSQSPARIHLHIKEGKLMLDLADPTKEQKRVRVAADWTPQEDTWYHIGAFWKSSKFGHLALMVDGHVIGETMVVDADGDKVHELLPSSMSADDNTDTVEKLPVGFWQVGEEIVEKEYPGVPVGNRSLGNQDSTPHEHAANSVVTPYGFSIELNSGAPDHKINEISKPYLDSNVQLSASTSGIPEMNIRTESEFTSRTPEVCPKNMIKKQPPEDDEEYPSFTCDTQGETWTLDKSASEIPVKLSFQPPPNDNKPGGRKPDDITQPALFIIDGFVRRSSTNPDDSGDQENNQDQDDGGNGGGTSTFVRKHEIVECQNVTENSLTGCTRGLLGTQPQEWRPRADVELMGVPISGADSYPNEKRVVHVDEEFIGPVDTYTPNQQGYLGPGDKNIPLRHVRNQHGTSMDGDGNSATVTPVFALKKEKPEHRYLAEADDIPAVTLIDEGKNIRGEYTISRSRTFMLNLKKKQPGQKKSGLRTRVALARNVDSKVNAGRPSRVLKFPSGEIFKDPENPPDGSFGSANAQVSNVETVKGSGDYLILDEKPGTGSSIKVRTHPPSNLNKSSQQKPVEAPGALIVGSRVFGYADSQHSERTADEPNKQAPIERYRFSSLSSVTRNYLQPQFTTPGYVLNRGDHVMVLSEDQISVGTFESAVDPTSNKISINGDGNFSDGYFRAGDEIFSLNDGQMPKHPIVNRGLFRGSFGTTPQAHAKNDLVLKMPWRYPDRVPKTVVDRLFSSMTFHVIERNRPDATWTGIEWDLEIGPSETPRGSFPRVLVRANREIPWHKVERWYDMRNKSSIEFDRPIASDRIELLFLFDYEDGAYNDQNWRRTHGWKTTSRLERVELNYRTPARTYMYRDQK